MPILTHEKAPLGPSIQNMERYTVSSYLPAWLNLSGYPNRCLHPQQRPLKGNMMRTFTQTWVSLETRVFILVPDYHT